MKVWLITVLFFGMGIGVVQAQNSAKRNKPSKQKKNNEESLNLGGLFGGSESEDGESVDLGKVFEALQSDEASKIGKQIGDVLKSAEESDIEKGNVPDLDKAVNFLNQLSSNSNISASEKAKFKEMLQTMQTTAPSSMEYAKALSEDGRLERKGALLEGMSDDEFNKQKAFVDYFYTSEKNPHATKADRRNKFDKYVDACGGATEQERNIMFQVFEAERNGTETKTYDDIKIKENGEEVSLKEIISNTAKETANDFQKKRRESKNKYKNMSYEEFKKEYGDMPIPDESKKEAMIKELYNEVQRNGGDILRAIEEVMKRHEG